jgi:hypothetical protein
MDAIDLDWWLPLQDAALTPTAACVELVCPLTSAGRVWQPFRIRSPRTSAVISGIRLDPDAPHLLSSLLLASDDDRAAISALHRAGLLDVPEGTATVRFAQGPTWGAHGGAGQILGPLVPVPSSRRTVGVLQRVWSPTGAVSAAEVRRLISAVVGPIGELCTWILLAPPVARMFRFAADEAREGVHGEFPGGWVWSLFPDQSFHSARIKEAAVISEPPHPVIAAAAGSLAVSLRVSLHSRTPQRSWLSHCAHAFSGQVLVAGANGAEQVGRWRATALPVSANRDGVVLKVGDEFAAAIFAISDHDGEARQFQMERLPDRPSVSDFAYLECVELDPSSAVLHLGRPLIDALLGLLFVDGGRCVVRLPLQTQSGSVAMLAAAAPPGHEGLATYWEGDLGFSPVPGEVGVLYRDGSSIPALTAPASRTTP